MTIQEFVEKHGVKIDSTLIDARPDGGDWVEGSAHWKVVVTVRGKRMTIYYSQGPAVVAEPTAADVLDSLALDASCAQGTFEDFCSEFGYDTDSRKVERLFKACQKVRVDLERLFRSDRVEELIYQVERL